ncbi:MAG: OmpA family protein [Saprospiraceae bacterium]|nr:OmpA family protein [Saprospiraceae bacterium]
MMIPSARRYWTVSISICFCCCWSIGGFAQELLQADNYYESGAFDKAAEQYADLVKIRSNDYHLRYRWAASLFEINRLDETIAVLEAVIEEAKRPPVDAYFKLGQAHHHKFEFAKAIAYYKRYLLKAPEKNRYYRQATYNIERCAIGMKHNFQRNDLFIENVGADVNSPFDEINPIESPNYDSRIYFSSNRLMPDTTSRSPHQHFDMYATEIVQGAWSAAALMNSALNTPVNEVLEDFSSDGMVAFFTRSPDMSSSLHLVDSFSVSDSANQGSNWNGPFIEQEITRGLYHFSDSFLVFSSNRAGGHGGFDLYYSVLKQGGWTSVTNFGPAINGPFDEITPFLAKDGRTLFFSSNSLLSMGGFDVMQSRFDPKELTWSTPNNLGNTINSAGHDLYYRLSTDGSIAYFSSDRKSGHGGQDIYTAYFKNRQLAQLDLPGSNMFYHLKGYDTPSLSATDETSEELEKPKSSFTIPTLLYKDDQVLTPQNTAKLKTISGLFKSFPHLKLEIVCHSDQPVSTNFDLFFSLKRAEQIQSYLVSVGTKASSIFLKGLGGTYPLAKHELNGKLNPTAQFYNRRIDLRIHNTGQLPMDLNYDIPEISSTIAADEAKQYYRRIKGLSYKVQFAATDQLFKGDLIGKYEDPCVEKNSGEGDYFYCSGIFSSFEGALRHLGSIKKEGFEGAEIIGYMDGLRLKANQIDAQLLSTYPDLKKYTLYID